jgi:hypothetical protein
MCLMIRIQEGNNDPTKKLACLKGTEHEIAFCQFHNVQYDDYVFFYRNLHMRKKYSWRISKYVYFLGAYPQVRLNTFGVFGDNFVHQIHTNIGLMSDFCPNWTFSEYDKILLAYSRATIKRRNKHWNFAYLGS